jgi:hypothetical protein
LLLAPRNRSRRALLTHRFSHDELLCIHAVEPKSNLLGNSINPFAQLRLILIADEVVPPIIAEY